MIFRHDALTRGMARAAGLVLLGWGSCRTAKQHQGRQRFHAVVSGWLYLFSAFGVAFAGLPIIGVPPCL